MQWWRVYFTPEGEFTHINTTFRGNIPARKFASMTRPGDFFICVEATDELGAVAGWAKFMREQDNG